MALIPISYNIRSLRVRKITTAVTAFGIALVVWVLAVALMLAAGIERAMHLSGSRDNAILLRQAANAELASNIDSPKVGQILASPGVQRDGQGAPIGVGEVVTVILVEKTGTDGRVTNVQVRGVTDNVRKLRSNVRIVEGRFAEPGTNEVIIGKQIAGRYKGMVLHGSLELKKNRPVQVVGIFAAGSSSFESEVWADIDTVRTAFGRQGSVSSITVKLESAAHYDAFAQAVQSDKQLRLDVMRENEYFETQSEGTTLFLKVLGIAIAFFISLGAIIGAMITMYAAVSNREREIGTLRALGFSRTVILISFVLEAWILALAGGIVGVIGALGMSFVQFSILNFATWSEVVFTFHPTPQILLTSLVVGGFMGVIGGVLPAVRAARTPPISAMRA